MAQCAAAQLAQRIQSESESDLVMAMFVGENPHLDGQEVWREYSELFALMAMRLLNICPRTRIRPVASRGGLTSRLAYTPLSL